MRLTRHRKGVRMQVSAVDAQLLRELGAQLLSLVGEPVVSDDPLAALVGLPPGDVAPPDDPVLARLLPDAYRDDPAAAGDFRRYTDADLRAGKRADVKAVLADLGGLPDGGGRLDVDRDGVDRWLGALNDMRLALGTALGVTDDTDPDDVVDQDPAYQAMQVYAWLGQVQEWLLSCVEPRAH